MDKQISEKIKIAGFVGISLIIAAEVLWRFYKKFSIEKWKRVGEVVEIYCFPIKSCGFIKIDEIDCVILGAKSDHIRDRTFMIVNSDNLEFVTGRKYPKLVQIKPTVAGDLLKLSAPGKEDFNLNFNDLGTKNTNAIVWDETVDVFDCGNEVAEWISEFILGEKSGLRLVYFPGTNPSRDVRKKNKIYDTTFKKDTGALHDATSFMLINKTSVDDLNTRISNSVEPVQFRPNFVVKTNSKPYDEDQWKTVKIGEVIFQNVKPCTRCIFTNVNLAGEKDENDEPLKTLKTYRKFEKSGDSPVMGIHLGLRKQGKVKIGDQIYIRQ